MKRARVFVGCSADSVQDAKMIALFLQNAFSVEPWWDNVRRPSHHFLEDLEGALSRCDLAVLVATPGEIEGESGQSFVTLRDSLLVQYGVFVGRLGRKRVFVVATNPVDMRLPADLSGIGYLAPRADSESDPTGHFHELQRLAGEVSTQLAVTWCEFREPVLFTSRVG